MDCWVWKVPYRQEVKWKAFTYVFACHSLDENFGVLVDEDMRFGFLGVDTSLGHGHESS